MPNKHQGLLSKIFVLLAALLLVRQAEAHNINYALENAPVGSIALFYAKMGFTHILPYGLDHILFVVALCLLNTQLKTIIWQATAFTIAHSITLALSMQGVIELPAQIVEPVIALSIVFIAVENMLLKDLKLWRVLIVFFFGLVHGLGFAGVLNEVGLPPGQFFSALFFFNVGVELGQVAVILLVYLLLIKPWGKTPHYRKYVVFPLSLLIAVVALYWFFERL
jgi:hydrogenase/urease accessory protein HupE